MRTENSNDFVWTCDHCNKEFESKKASDNHELNCVFNPKNKTFPRIDSPKKVWLYIWLITLAVFATTVFISIKYSESQIFLFTGGVLATLALVNIGVGIIAFLAMVFARNEFKKNEPPQQLKSLLLICLIYLFISPVVFATEGYKAKNNEEYKNRFYKGVNTTVAIPTISPIPQSFKEELFNAVNDYRKEKKLSLLSNNEDVCAVAENLVSREEMKDELKKEEYSDKCPLCNQVGYNWVKFTPTSEILSKWKENDEANKNLTGKYKYGCIAIKEQKVIFIFANKLTSTKTNNTNSTVNNTSSVNNSGTVECIGPDGKNFNTSMSECKSLNEKWGKPVDYMVECTIHQDCGGGSRKLKLSECNNSTCCQLGSGWSFYLSRDKCKQDQGNLNKGSTNNNPPSNNTNNSQNTSPKVAFQATETSIKGTYYCYENKVNEMVTQQSFVKSYRELYEGCTSSTYNYNVYTSCLSANSCDTSDTSEGSCFDKCHKLGFSKCSEYYSTYLSEQSKLNNMRWSNCP